MFLSFFSINCIASVPFIKSHCAHDIVIRHRIKAVKCVLNFLFRTDSCLKTSCCTSWRITLPIHDHIFSETPRFEYKTINIFRLDKVVFQFQLIEVKNLGVIIDITLLVIRNQSLSCCFYQTASVLNL